jgi:hypothetical protein
MMIAQQHVQRPLTSYLVAAVGKRRGLLTQVFAHDAAQAERVINASCLDWLNEEMDCKCIDTDAAIGFHMEGDAAYIRSVIANSAAAQQ